MKLKPMDSLNLAHAVLRDINVTKATFKAIMVTGYENGREHGLSAYHLDTGIRVCWAEHRSSDDIVVYVSEPNEDFDADSHVPTERAYWAAKYFQPSDVAGAAKFISKILNKKPAPL